MQALARIASFPERRPAVALGKFDGLHIGHAKLAEEAARLGEPRLVALVGVERALGKEQKAPLVAPDDRSRVLAGWAQERGWQKPPGETHIPLEEVMHMGPPEFVGLLESLGAIALAAGEDFRFGKGRSGGALELERLARDRGLLCAVTAFEKLDALGGEPASSSLVRRLLSQGKALWARRVLGRPHRLCFSTPGGIPLNCAPLAGEYSASFPASLADQPCVSPTGTIRILPDGSSVPACASADLHTGPGDPGEEP